MRYLAMFYQVTGSVTGWHGYCRVSVSVAKDGPSEAEAGSHLGCTGIDLVVSGPILADIVFSNCPTG